MTCFECDPVFGGDVWHCHELSIQHADGTTECLDPACELPHPWHHWQLPCHEALGSCSCLPVEVDPGVVAPALAA